MKKFFAYSLLILVLFRPFLSHSSVISAAEKPAPRSIPTQESLDKIKQTYQEIPNPNDKKALEAYIKKRLQTAIPANMTAEEAASPSSTSSISNEEILQKQQKTMSAYEQIYADSLQRAAADETLNQNLKLEGTFYREVTPDRSGSRFVPDFPYVTVKLSEDKEIIAPAEEHIAYLLTKIKVEPTGLLNINEEFVFISNNEGFPNGFFRILPKYSTSRNGERRRFDLTLSSVTVNNEEVPYKITEIGNYLYIEPQKPLNLPTGIYTYRFNYLVDRAVWFYENFDEFYWDITAKTLKNVVGSANAVVILPSGNEFLAQNAIVSTKTGLLPERVTITNLSRSSLGFADTEALAVGDDIHLFITLEKGTLVAPDFSKKYLWFLHDNGAVLFAFLALLAIFASYKISLAQIRRNKDKTKAKIKKTPAVFRLINSNKYDNRSFLAEILELCAKNICELKKNDAGAVLIKKTDELKNLSKPQQKLAKILFPGAETSLVSETISALKLKRAYAFLRRTVYRQYHVYILKLNSLYLLFGLSMLVCGIIGASATAVNPVHTFWIILTCTLLFFPYMALLVKHFSRNTVNLAVKAFALLSVLGVSGWLSIYTSNTYAALIVISVWMIVFYYNAFARRSGLLRNKIRETEDYKSYLAKNPELAVSARDFTAKMPYIFAFGLEDKYKDVAPFGLITHFDRLLTQNPKKE